MTLVAVVLGFAILVDQALLRFYLEPRTFSFRAKHPYYHHTLVRNFSGTARWDDIEYPFFTNSLGFRDRAVRTVALKPTGGRIVFVGDSVVESVGVPYEESFLGVLEDQIRDSGIELLNAAVLSYSPTIYLLKTKYFTEEIGLRFNELFVFIDISDIQDEIRYKSFTPRMPTSWESALVSPGGMLYRNSFAFRTVYETLVSRGEKKIATDFDAQRWAYYDIAFSDLHYSDDDRRKVESVPREQEGRWIWSIDKETFRQWGQEGLELAGSHMGDLAKYCRDRNIRLTVVVYPAPPQIYARDLESIQVQYWKRFSKEHGVDFINLFPAFIGPSNPDPDLVYGAYFIRGDMHFNAEGHRFLARLLAAHLQSRNAAQ